MHDLSPPQCTGLLFGVLEVMQASLATVSQLLVLLAMARTRDDCMAFVAVCLAGPLYNLFFVEQFTEKRQGISICSGVSAVILISRMQRFSPT